MPEKGDKSASEFTAAYSGTQEVFPASDSFKSRAHISSLEEYRALYDASINDPEAFWGERAKRLDWIKPFSIVKNTSFEPGGISIKWFEDGTLNACYNCLDRHLEKRGDKVAVIFEPDEPHGPSMQITYRQMHHDVCKFANVLKKLGVKKGDRVTIYMPMIPEAMYSMLACARIGAIHSVIFAGFAPASIRDRVLDCDSDIIITADEGRRGGKAVPLKKNVDEALKECPDVKNVLVVKNTGTEVGWEAGRDHWYHDLVDEVDSVCEPEEMSAEDPLFILYTSGSTGKPKGVMHTTAGYLVYTSLTHKYVFDYREGDVFWCTADVGWITGHSYMVYGPMLNGATQVFFEGIPTYPDASRFWDVVDRHKVNIFYTAPTAIRALMRLGDEPVTKHSRESLRVLGTVGEPINPEAWRWYHEVVGDNRCPVVDTWWQTETGGIMIAPLPGAIPQKPGSATLPFFGIKLEVVDTDGNILEGECEGLLTITDSWPGQMRGVYKNADRFEQTYFSAFKNRYFTADACRRDVDGYYWITGRVDDVINVSGHRLGTAEIESALVDHKDVAEAAVVGYPHEVKGQGIYAFVTLKQGVEADAELEKDLITHVRNGIGPIAKPDLLHFTPALPKTRSGKIMRRILRKIAENEPDKLGDTSTLADPTVVESLVENRKSR